MSSISAPGEQSSSKRAIAIGLAVIAVVAIVIGIIYFVEPAKDLPGFLGHIALTPKHRHRANAARSLRGAVAIVIAVVCAAGAWFMLKKGKPASTDTAAPAADTPAKSSDAAAS